MNIDMKQVTIMLSTIADVKRFVGAAAQYPFDICLHSGKYAVDGKSLLGVFSLELTKPIECEIQSDDCGKFLDEIAFCTVK